jgi:hypothetical protein
MSTDIRLQPYVAPTPAEIVEFDTTDPNLPGTVFTPDSQQASNTLYVSTEPTTIGQTWIWNTTTNLYETYTVNIPDSTPFLLYGTTIDAGSNKTAFIQRNGPILINSTSTSYNPLYVYNRDGSGAANGPLFRRDSRVTSGYGLLIQNYKFSVAGPSTVTQLRVNHDGSLLINDAYTLPNVDGTAGQVPTTDGAGNVSWQSGGSSGVFGISDSAGIYTYYPTFTLAMAAASSGDTIEMFADVEETGSVTITLKDGVTINGNGHTYTLSVDDATNALTVSSVGTYDLYNWSVKRAGRANGTTTGYTFYSTQTAAQINFFGVKLENTFGTCFFGGGQIKNAYGVGYLNGLYGGTASYPVVHNSYFESKTSGVGMFVPYTNIYNSTGVSNSGVGINCNGNVFESTGISISNTGILAQRMNKCLGISTSGTGLSGSCRDCMGISTSGVGGGGGAFYNSTLISSSNYGLSGATAYNCSVQSSTSIATSSCSIYNSTIRCLWDNAGGHCTITFALGLREILNSTLEVTNSAAYCINAYVGSTWKYANNSFKGATIPITPSLIQGITNTSDSQGNILI